MSELQQPGGISMEQSTHSAMEQNYFVSFPAQYFNMLPNFQTKSHGTMSGKKISLDIK